MSRKGGHPPLPLNSQPFLSISIGEESRKPCVNAHPSFVAQIDHDYRYDDVENGRTRYLYR
jgi:hypothetical protein